MSDTTIIDCPDCNERTFVGVAQGYTSDDKPYPVGTCAHCEMELTPISGKTDLQLLMEFRQKDWDNWVKFCVNKGYDPVIYQ